MGIKCRCDTSNISVYVSRIRNVARAETRHVAHEVRDRAAENAPKKTGALAASIYVVTDLGSDYANRTGEALSLNSHTELFPEEEQGADGSATVVVAATYAELIENGTVNSPAQPFLSEATSMVAESLEERYGKAVQESLATG